MYSSPLPSRVNATDRSLMGDSLKVKRKKNPISFILINDFFFFLFLNREGYWENKTRTRSDYLWRSCVFFIIVLLGWSWLLFILGWWWWWSLAIFSWWVDATQGTPVEHQSGRAALQTGVTTLASPVTVA